MVEMASVVLCMKLLSALHLLQEWSPHQVAKTLMPLLTSVLILLCQQWIRHLRRYVLETWCPTDLHSGFALAWGGVWEALGAALEAYGKWHDRVLCEKVGAHEGAWHVSHKSPQDAKLFHLKTGIHPLAVNCGLFQADTSLLRLGRVLIHNKAMHHIFFWVL